MNPRIGTIRLRIASLLALVLVASTVVGGPASAVVRPEDRVGGIPLLQASYLAAEAPDLGVPAGVLETSDGMRLWERDADSERAMASTTKIMTAVVVLEAVHDLYEQVRVPERAARVGEAGVGLQPGQRVSVRTLLEAMLVHSGNDAAVALASHVAGSEEAFVAMMNEKAAELDLRHTHFTNPHGLDESGHRTSAGDLAVLARYAMAKPVFREIVAKRAVDVPHPGGPRRFEASNELLDTYPGASGVKTGWTNRAGYCLVASAERDGIELIAVVLGATSEGARFAEARRLLDWGFEHYRHAELISRATTVALVPVADYLDETLPVVVSDAVRMPVFDLAGPIERRLDLPHAIEAPLERGVRVGTLSLIQGERLIAQVPLVAERDVAEPTFFERIAIWFARRWRTLRGEEPMAKGAVLIPAR